jgi:hypothetical protein
MGEVSSSTSLLVPATLGFSFDSNDNGLWGVELTNERFNTSVTFQNTTGTTWDFLLDGQADLTCTISCDSFFPATAYIYEAYLVVDGTIVSQTAKNNPFPVPGDANGDAVANVSDLSILAANWGFEEAAITDAFYDLNDDGAINAGDLGLLASSWDNTPKFNLYKYGDFNYDGKINVSDLSVIAANYNSGSRSELTWQAACAQVFGTSADEQKASASADDSSEAADDAVDTTCSSLGLSLVAALAMFGLMMGWNGRRLS